MSEVTSSHHQDCGLSLSPSPGLMSCPPSVSAPAASWTPPGSPAPLIRLLIRPLDRPTATSCHLTQSPASREASHPSDTGPGVPQSSEINQVTLLSRHANFSALLFTLSLVLTVVFMSLTRDCADGCLPSLFSDCCWQQQKCSVRRKNIFTLSGVSP